jgi:hypothetical protein
MSIKPPQNSHFSVPDDPSLDPFYYLSKSSPAPVDRLDAYGLHGPTTTTIGPLGMNGFGTTATVGKTTAPLRSNPAYPQRSNSVMMQPTSTNLADQNPPCNTLYVGNLPSNTIEDELRQLFSKCTGYKRMYFRTKPQGPMCFVEFDDVIYASQTMSDLQGQALSNSLKGGIRLSFSKNPLFIKPQHRSASRPFDLPL